MSAQKNTDSRIAEVTKLSCDLERQGIAPDEIVARVRSELARRGLGITDDVLKLALNGIWVQSPID